MPPDVSYLHPCAKAVTHSVDPRGRVTYQITYVHQVVRGKCIICDEWVPIVLDSFVRADSVRPSSADATAPTPESEPQ
jgi:hypothetical protein